MRQTAPFVVTVGDRAIGLRPAEIGHDAMSLLQLLNQLWVTPHTHSAVIGTGDPSSAASEFAADRKRDEHHVRIPRVSGGATAPTAALA